MVGHGGSSAGSYLADPTSPIPSHCASIVVTSTLRVNILECVGTLCALAAIEVKDPYVDVVMLQWKKSCPQSWSPPLVLAVSCMPSLSITFP